MKRLMPLLMAILLLTGCDGDNPSPGNGQVVHMSGFIVTSTGTPIAGYWNNGDYTSLVEDSVYSNVRSMTVSNSTAVIGGYQFSVSAGGKVFAWTDGNKSFLDDAAGSDAFVAVSGSGQSAVWFSRTSGEWVVNRNGISQPLEDTVGSWPTAVAVKGSDAYISGTAQGYEAEPDTEEYYSDQYAQCWKNDQLIFREEEKSFASIVFVHNNDIYLGGHRYQDSGSDRIACYWKNGVRTDLTDGSQDAAVNSIFVDGTGVYASGTIQGHACYWKNGELNNLPHGIIRSGGNAICVKDADVYVAGYDNEYPALWKNSVKETFEHQDRRGELKFVIVSGE